MTSIVNSTVNTISLSSGQSWNQDVTKIDDIKAYASAVIAVACTQNSATDGIVCRWSIDGINFDFVEYFSTSNDDYDINKFEYIKTITVDHRARYFNLYYINGDATNSIRIQTAYKAAPQDITVSHSTCICGTVWDTSSTGINGMSHVLSVQSTALMLLGTNDLSTDAPIDILISTSHNGPFYNCISFTMNANSTFYDVQYGIFPYVKLQSLTDASLSLKYAVMS